MNHLACLLGAFIHLRMYARAFSQDSSYLNPNFALLGVNNSLSMLLYLAAAAASAQRHALARVLL